MWRFWRVIFSNGITDGFKRTTRIATWPVRHLNCRRNHRGIWNGRSIRWHVDCSVKIIDGFTDGVSAISPPLFLQLLPNPNSSHLQTTSPPSPQTKISLILAQQVIFLEFLWSQHTCSDLPTDFINICK